MIDLILDFETANTAIKYDEHGKPKPACDLSDVGAEVYSQHPLTEVISLTCTYNNEEFIWAPEFGRDELLIGLARDPDVLFVPHASGFEKAIWRNIMVPVYGFPDVPNERWRDTQAACAYYGLPLALEKATGAGALAQQNQKDTEGSKLTVALSRPLRSNKERRKAGTVDSFDRSEETLNRVYLYNKRDILCQAELHGRLGHLPDNELRVWQLDQIINERGIGVDTAFCQAALECSNRARVSLLQEFNSLTDGLAPTQTMKLREWCEARGAWTPSLDKEHVAALIGPEDKPFAPENIFIDPKVARALRCRQLINHSSIAKLQRMIDCAASDGRVHGLLQFGGCQQTQRWAGRLFNPQNFPRGTVRIGARNEKGEDVQIPPPPEMMVGAIMTGDPDYVEMVIGSPAIECVASGLRHALVARTGCVFNSGDYSGIECRIDLALAGEHRITQMMADGQDVYCDMAERIYHRKITKANTEERQIGKNTVLGCGFQMGWQTFKARYCPHHSDEFAQGVIRAYRQDWAPKVPIMWKALEGAALAAVREPKTFEAYGVEFKTVDGPDGAPMWLTARLPSGRLMWYFKPRLRTKTMPWSTPENPDKRLAWCFYSWAGETGQRELVDAYGGLITENVVQGLARDLMVYGMFKCEANGFRIVLTVHDEILTEPKTSDLKALEQIMCDVPPWCAAIKCPIQIEAWEGDRYRK